MSASDHKPSPAHRCYECGRRVTEEMSTCPSCGAVQQSLCEYCGATVSVYRETCPDCDAERATELFVPRRRLLKFVLLLLVLGIGGAAGLHYFGRDARRDAWRDYESAYREFAAGHHQAAAVGFAAWLRDHDEHATARYMLGLSRERCGHTEEARREVRRALELDPDLDAAALFLASRALEEGDVAAASALAGQALSGEPRPPFAHYLLGRVLVKPGFRDIPRAEWHLRQAVEGGLDLPGAWLLLAEIMTVRDSAYQDPLLSDERDRRLTRAVEHAEELAADHDGESWPYLLLARCLYASGEYDRAFAQLEMCRRRGGSGDDIELLTGRLLWRRGDEAGGTRILDGLLETDPEPATWLRVAAFFRELGRDDLAAGVIADAIGHHPDDPGVILARGRALLEAGEAETADALLTEAVGAHQEVPLLRVWRAEVLLALGRTGEAEAELRQTAELPEGPVLAPLRLADLLLDTPREDADFRPRIAEAERRIEATDLRLAPGDPAGLFAGTVRGKLLLRRRRLPEAVEVLSSVTSRNPGDARAHRLLARALEESDEFDLAALELTAVMRLEGATRELRLRRARAWLSAGEASRPAARRELSLLVEEDSADPEARLLLSRALLAEDPPALEAAGEVLSAGLSRTTPAPRLRIALGRLHLRTGDLEAGRREFERARAEAADAEERLLAVAALSDALDQQAGKRLSPAAREAFRQALAEWPADLPGRLRFASLLLEQGDLDAAEERVREVLAADGDRIAALRLAFEIEASRPEPDRAELTRLSNRVSALAPEFPDDLYLRGRLALAAGDVEQAATLLATGSARSPRDARAAFHLGRARLLSGDVAGAREPLERATRLRPDLLPARLLLAETAFRQGAEVYRKGAVLKTVAELRFALGQEPEHLPALALLATTLYKIGREGSVEMLRRAREACKDLLRELAERGQEGPAVDRAWLLLGGICHALDDRPGLVEACRSLVRAHPQDASALHRLGLALLFAGEPAAAADYLEEALAFDPEAYPILADLARALDRAGRREEAAAALQGWISGHPGDPAAWTALGRYSRPGEAERAFREALRRDPDRIPALLSLVEQLLANQRFDEAEELLRDLRTRTTFHGEVDVQLGRVLLALDLRSQEALDLLRGALTAEMEYEESRALGALLLLRALVSRNEFRQAAGAARFFIGLSRGRRDLRPGSPEAAILAEGSYFAGVTLHMTGDPDSAETCYRRTLLLRPDHHLSRNNLADLLLTEAAPEDPEAVREALRLVRRAVELRPELPQYRETLGRARLRSGDPEAARSEFETALRLLREKARPDSELAPVLLGLSRAELAAGRPEAARERFAAALDADPDLERDPAAVELRRALESD